MILLIKPKNISNPPKKKHKKHHKNIIENFQKRKIKKRNYGKIRNKNMSDTKIKLLNHLTIRVEESENFCKYKIW